MRCASDDRGGRIRIDLDVTLGKGGGAMTDSSPPPVPQPASPERSNVKGCLFYGCLSVVILSFLVAVGLFFAGRYALNKFKGVMQEYTQTQPEPLAPVLLTTEQKAELRARVDTFRSQLDAGVAQPLELNADEANQLIAGSQASGPLAKHFRIRLDGSTLLGTASIPLDEMGPISLPGRFLNGEAAFGISLSEGRLNVRLQDFKVQGKSLPPEILQAMRSANFGDKMGTDPNLAPWLEKLSAIEIRDGKILISPKSATPQP